MYNICELQLDWCIEECKSKVKVTLEFGVLLKDIMAKLKANL